MKIAVIVPGRFHAFDLCREWLKSKHQVVLFSNYPKGVVKRFGIEPKHVRSLLIHGILSRLLRVLQQRLKVGVPEQWLCQWFGRWAANQIIKESWDVVYAWSGVGEECFKGLQDRHTVKVCQRSSSHILTQAAILREEEIRVSSKMEKPSPWIISRELSEYQLAHFVHVPSHFAEATFMDQAFDSRKIITVPLGASTKSFRPLASVIQQRQSRILSSNPIRVLYVGTASFRKGFWDLLEVVRGLSGKNFEFTFVGAVAKEVESLLGKIRSLGQFIPKQPHNKLQDWYARGDIFILPTLEDGFPIVLAQAHAAGLPILTTPNGAGHDLVEDGRTGWVLPIRNPEAFIKKLQWCDSHRKELAEMVGKIYETSSSRDWKQVSEELIVCFKNRMSLGLK